MLTRCVRLAEFVKPIKGYGNCISVCDSGADDNGSFKVDKLNKGSILSGVRNPEGFPRCCRPPSTHPSVQVSPIVPKYILSMGQKSRLSSLRQEHRQETPSVDSGKPEVSQPRQR